MALASKILALASKTTGLGLGLGLEHAVLEPIPEILFLVSHFNFLFVPCGGLSWLPVSSIVLVSVLKQTPPVMLLRNYGGGSIILPPDNGILKHPRHFIT